jgi:hypothetical protein
MTRIGQFGLGDGDQIVYAQTRDYVNPLDNGVGTASGIFVGVDFAQGYYTGMDAGIRARDEMYRADPGGMDALANMTCNKPYLQLSGDERAHLPIHTRGGVGAAAAGASMGPSAASTAYSPPEKETLVRRIIDLVKYGRNLALKPQTETLEPRVRPFNPYGQN